MEHVLQRMRDANDLVQRAGPYVLLEVLLPGGTLLALVLFLYRRSRRSRRGSLAGALARRLDHALDLDVVAGGVRSRERDGLEPLGL